MCSDGLVMVLWWWCDGDVRLIPCSLIARVGTWRPELDPMGFEETSKRIARQRLLLLCMCVSVCVCVHACAYIFLSCIASEGKNCLSVKNASGLNLSVDCGIVDGSPYVGFTDSTVLHLTCSGGRRSSPRNCPTGSWGLALTQLHLTCLLSTLVSSVCCPLSTLLSTVHCLL